MRRESLAPLQQGLLAAVRAAVGRQDGELEAARTQRLDAACEQAEALVLAARLEGERAAARQATQLRAAAVRTAQEARLQAQRALLDTLHADALEAARRLRTDPAYDRLLDRLAGLAREQLGPGAELERDPDGAGGLRARLGVRSVDYTLPVLVERAIDDLGEEVESLWRQAAG